MPAFLAGHILYVFCFLRGCDVVSLRQLALFSPLKKLICLAAVGYSIFVWSLLYPHFDGVLRPVLACYIAALMLQFIAAMFSHSRLIPIGSALYVISDSFIGLAAFVYPHVSATRSCTHTHAHTHIHIHIYTHCSQVAICSFLSLSCL